MGATKADLRTAVLNITDEAGGNFLGTSTLDQLIDDQHRKLYALVARAHPDIYAKDVDVTVPGTGIVTKAADFLSLYKVELYPDTDRMRVVRRFGIAERGRVADIRYRVTSDGIEFRPTIRSSGKPVRIWYIPTPTLLTSLGADQLDNTLDEYREYIVNSVAVMASIKDDDPEKATVLMQVVQNIEAKLVAMVGDDDGEPDRAEAAVYGRSAGWFEEDYYE